MSINPNPFNCDICTRAKQETNHWFLGMAVCNDSLPVGENSVVGYKVVKWNETAHYVTRWHLCGLECAAKWLTKKLSALQQIPVPSLGTIEEKP